MSPRKFFNRARVHHEVRGTGGFRNAAEKIIIAGSGGQGIMLLGKVLAQAAMNEGFHVTWFPSYGAEVRGGAAYCMVVISGAPIGSPYVETADTLIIMNGISFEKFPERLRKSGLVLINASFVPRIPPRAGFYAYPFTGEAASLGDVRTANMIALGSYLALRTGLVGMDTVEAVIEQIAPAEKKNLVRINQEAVRRGFYLAREAHTQTGKR